MSKEEFETINLSILDFKAEKQKEAEIPAEAINLSILDFKASGVRVEQLGSSTINLSILDFKGLCKFVLFP